MKRNLLLWILTISLLLGVLPTGAVATAPEPGQVSLSSQRLTIDGVTRDAQKYNIDGFNYFKLRDIAYLLSGTKSQFEVVWDETVFTVSIITGQPYTPVGGELATDKDNSAMAVPSGQTILVNGTLRDDLHIYNIGDENYFRLLELGSALNFDVDFDEAANTALALFFSRWQRLPLL